MFVMSNSRFQNPLVHDAFEPMKHDAWANIYQIACSFKLPMTFLYKNQVNTIHRTPWWEQTSTKIQLLFLDVGFFRSMMAKPSILARGTLILAFTLTYQYKNSTNSMRSLSVCKKQKEHVLLFPRIISRLYQ